MHPEQYLTKEPNAAEVDLLCGRAQRHKQELAKVNYQRVNESTQDAS